MEKRRAIGEEQEVGRERANYGLCGGAGGEGAEESDQWQRRRAMRKENIVKRTQSKHLGKIEERLRDILKHPCRALGGVAGALSGRSLFNFI